MYEPPKSVWSTPWHPVHNFQTFLLAANTWESARVSDLCSFYVHVVSLAYLHKAGYALAASPWPLKQQSCRYSALTEIALMWICTFEVCRQSGANRALNAGLESQHGLSLSGEILIEALCEFECWEGKLRHGWASESNANLAQNDFCEWNFSCEAFLDEWEATASVFRAGRFALPAVIVWCSGLVQVLQQGLWQLNSGPCSCLVTFHWTPLNWGPSLQSFSRWARTQGSVCVDAMPVLAVSVSDSCDLASPGSIFNQKQWETPVICMNSNAVHVLRQDRQSCRDVASLSSLGIWAVQTSAIPRGSCISTGPTPVGNGLQFAWGLWMSTQLWNWNKVDDATTLGIKYCMATIIGWSWLDIVRLRKAGDAAGHKIGTWKRYV